MARSRDPFNQALRELRTGIATGRLRSGGPVIVVSEAERLRLSVTPVREALARLEGEALVERAAGGGYLVARLEASDAIDGYRLLDHQLRLAGRLADPALAPVPPPPRRDCGDPQAAARQLFDGLVRGAGNRMLTSCHAAVRRRLAPLERVESRLFPDLESELADLYAAAGSWMTFGQAAAAYYDRRIRAAPLLVRLADEAAEPS